MQDYLVQIPIEPSTDATRRLLREKIRHYEKLASDLMDQYTVDTRERNGGGGGGGGESTKTKAFHPRSPEEIPFATVVAPLPEKPPSAHHRHPGSPRGHVPGANVDAQVSRANSRLSRAIDADEEGKIGEATKAYMEAGELYLQAMGALEQSKGKHPHPDQVQGVLDLLKRRMESTLDRLEQIKRGHVKVAQQRDSRVPSSPAPPSKGAPPTAAPVSAGCPPTSLTAEEIGILKRSSLIASGLFLPWSEEDAAALSRDRVKHPVAAPFADPDGPLPLSPKQQKAFHRWARPHDVARMRERSGLARRGQDVAVIKNVTPYTIRQQYVTDCSFIACLCICAAFERRFHKKLITTTLYPQDGHGNPVLSPSGKYMVKLWLNGVARCVTVDDRLPVDRQGNLLCSHTTKSTASMFELWVCLIEKAYMKLCGGYDFPGSNSGVDLFALTGWIPERILFARDPDNVEDYETHPERAWERILSASSYGDCLITVSAHVKMSESDAENIGLVLGHAYAVLGVIKTRNGTRLLQLKNPWASKGWKGRYSSGDKESWRDPAFRAEVGYNPDLAQKQDDGIFWISWQDILNYFQNFHLSWNPHLFKHRLTTHGFWPRTQGPPDDSFNVGENPQYVLSMSDRAIEQKATVWVLISRHVTKQEQGGQEATDYLTVHIHRNSGKRERIWYPGKAGKRILHGAYTNNPHVLIRYDLTGPKDAHLSLILSQYKRSNDLAYTLSCYCTEAFGLSQPEADLPHRHEFRSEWKGSTAGGPVGQDDSFLANPSWAIGVPEGGARMQFRLSTGPKVAAHAMLVPVAEFGDGPRRATGKPVVDVPKYRHALLVTERRSIPRGAYALIVSNYEKGQEAIFHLNVFSSVKVRMEKLK